MFRWGDLLRGYRKTYGSQSLASSTGPVEHYTRTNLTQLDVNSKRLFDVGSDHRATQTALEKERHARHGRGLTLFTMTDEDARRRGEVVRRSTTSNLEAASGVPGSRMFGILSMGVSQGPAHAVAAVESARGSEVISGPSRTRTMPASAPAGPRSVRDNGDSWIGHTLIDPAAGKRPIVRPPDPRGRRDLFEVLNQRAPATPSDDAWLGHRLMDPSRGKAHPPGPEQRMGRKDLFPIVQQQALLEAPVGVGQVRGPDPLGDSWIGHAQIDPRKGKAWVSSGVNKLTRVQDAVNRWDGRPNNQAMAEEFGPLGKVRTARCPPGPVASTVPAVLVHQGPYPDDIGNRVRREVAGPRSKEANETINRKRALKGPTGLSNIKSKEYETAGAHSTVKITRRFDGKFANHVV